MIWLRAGLACTLAALLCACAGTVVVDHAIAAEVAVRDASGRMIAGEVVPIPRNPKMASPFDFVEYRDEYLTWTFWGPGDVIVNRAPAVQCLRFDEARVASNFRDAPVPLSVYHWAVLGKTGRTLLLPERRRKEPSYFTPPPLCLEPGEQVTLVFGSDLRELFPNQRMFNTSRPQGDDLAIADKGVGNWHWMHVPVTIGSERRSIDIKLTALDSKARISHY